MNAGGWQDHRKPAQGMLESVSGVAGDWVDADFWLVVGQFPGKANDPAFKQ